MQSTVEVPVVSILPTCRSIMVNQFLIASHLIKYLTSKIAQLQVLKAHAPMIGQ
jgi:hypothetical protein